MFEDCTMRSRRRCRALSGATKQKCGHPSGIENEARSEVNIPHISKLWEIKERVKMGRAQNERLTHIF